MNARPWRRVAAVAAGAVGIADLVRAGDVARPGRIGFLGVGVILGARYALLVGGLTLLLTVRGLLHGRRNAWILAVVASTVSVGAQPFTDADVVGLGAAAATIGVLVAGRRSFAGASDPPSTRRGLWTLTLGGAAVLVYATVGLYLLDKDFREPTALAESAWAAVRLLFTLSAPNIEPATRHGRWFVESVRFAALGVTAVAVVQIVATLAVRPSRRQHDRARVEALLSRFASTSLAPFHLLEDKSWFFASDGDAFVGYKVVGTTAVALGEPVGRPGSQGLAMGEFVAFCDRNGWAPAFHQCTPVGAALAARADLRSLKIGEEAIIDLNAWDLAAPGNKALRSAIRRIERGGARVVELPTPLDDALLDELQEVSDRWLDAAHHRERTFTVGRFDRDQVRAANELALRVEVDGQPSRILAFATLLPSFRSEEGNFDLMRRRPDAPNGAMDALFVGLIDRCRHDGKHGLNLGLAPLSGITGAGLTDRALRLLYEHGSRAFNFDGLRRYKAKWHPRWEPRYLLYRSDTDLARVARAISRAGEIGQSPGPLTRALSAIRRYPVTAALVGFASWLMAATAINRALFPHLLRQYGFGWHDLVRLQLWRLPTAQLLQTRPGWVWSNLALMLTVLVVAERRLGSIRTAAVFFLADWCSTIPILVGTRLAASLGMPAAWNIIAHRDGGPSSGAWALAGVLAVSLPSRRQQTIAGAAILVMLGAQIVVFHRLYGVQHLGAALVALALWRFWPGPTDAAVPSSSTHTLPT